MLRISPTLSLAVVPLADDVGGNLLPAAKDGGVTDLTYDIEKALADRVADNRADIDSSNGKQRRRINWLIVVFVGYKKMEVVRLPPFWAEVTLRPQRASCLQILTIVVTLCLQEDLGVLSY